MESTGIPTDEFNLQFKTRADIKNVLPADIYEAMSRASLLKSDLIDGASPATRHVKDFYKSFDTIFQFTKLSVSEPLQIKVSEWLKIKKGMEKPDNVLEGIRLFYLYYDELTKLGIGKMFDDPVIPPIGIERLLMDSAIEKVMRQKVKEAQQKRAEDENDEAAALVALSGS